ncbi:hypothetical protein BKA62DRAFT_429297 [Auriculariales sp. MPI-PUGE-AT-0066]|nr:hypothetical protein BKA62DRAFT_429297 [Auriculariales sp. MPI-PUGE-AT-0066]
MSIYHRTSVVLLRSVHGARLFATTRTTARPADDADDYIERPRSRRVIPTDLLDAKPGPARAQSAEPTPTQNTIPTDPTPPLKPTQAGSTAAATPSAPVQPAIAAIDTLTAPLTQADKGTGSTLQPARRQPKLISQSLLDASLAADKLQPPQAMEPTTNAASPKPQAPAAQKDSIDEPLERKYIDSDAADTTDTTGCKLRVLSPRSH